MKKVIFFAVFFAMVAAPSASFAADTSGTDQVYDPAQSMQDPINLNGVVNFFKKNISVLSTPGNINISPISSSGSAGKVNLGSGGGINLNQIMDFAMKVVTLLYQTGVYFFSGVFKLLGLDALWRSVSGMIQLPK